MSTQINIETNSISSIDILIEIVLRLLDNLYGVMGSDEFSMETFNYFNDSNNWKVRLKRRIDDLIIYYEVTIDNNTGEVIGFERVQD